MCSRCISCGHCRHNVRVHQSPCDELVAKTDVILGDFRLSYHSAENNGRGDKGCRGGKVEGGRELGGGDVARVGEGGHPHWVHHCRERLPPLLHHGEGPCFKLCLRP